MVGIATRANNNHIRSSERIPSIKMCFWRSYAFQIIQPLIQLSHLQHSNLEKSSTQASSGGKRLIPFQPYLPYLFQPYSTILTSSGGIFYEFFGFQSQAPNSKGTIVDVWGLCSLHTSIHNNVCVSVLDSGTYPWDLLSKRSK